jgi:hypothetical protein
MNQRANRCLVSVLVGVGLLSVAACGGGAATNAGAANNAAPAPLAAANAPPTAGPAMPPAAAPPATGAQAATGGATRYCGAIHNTTLNQDDTAELDLNPGPGFSGTVTVGGRTLQGGGAFQGSMTGILCGGYAASSGLSFQGNCPANGEFDGEYTINGQQGTFRMNTANCH